MKITKEVPGKTEAEIDKAAIILRANGDEPKVLVDRDMEAKTHAMLAEHNLASPLFARFRNGLLYAYLPGRACQLEELAHEEIWSCVAAKLGEYHAKMSRTDDSAGDSEYVDFAFLTFSPWLTRSQHED
jgi:ethanolamine kinase